MDKLNRQETPAGNSTYKKLSEQSSIFEESFTGMFEIEPIEPYIPEGVQGPLHPAVPLDGGLTALLVAGGAVGYRKCRARSKK